MRYVASLTFPLALAVVAAGLAAQVPSEQAERYRLAGGALRVGKPMEKFSLGVWAHSIGNFGDSPEAVRQHVGRLADAGFDLIIPCVKNPPGVVDFFTDVADVNETYPQWDPLKVLIEASHERGLKVHPWFCVFIEGDKSRLFREHPEYEAKNAEKRLRWACAMRPEVQDYLFSLYVSLAQRYHPDGLHLDYIRTGEPCQCDYCHQQMAIQGVDIETAAWATPAFEQWAAWRTRRITDFVRRMRFYTAAHQLELSAAVFRDYPACVLSQGQDWVRWAHEGLVDFVFPMSYSDSELEVRRQTRSHVELIDGTVPLWEGLMKGSLTPQQLTRQVRAVLQLRTQGSVIFHYPALTDDDLAAVKKYLESVTYLRQ